jgi:hypothetical protein
VRRKKYGKTWKETVLLHSRYEGNLNTGDVVKLREFTFLMRTIKQNWKHFLRLHRSLREPGQRSRYSDCATGRLRGRSSSPGRVKNFLFSTGYGTYTASYPMRTGGALSQAVKRPGCDADHSPPTSAVVKKTCIYTSTPLYVFMA